MAISFSSAPGNLFNRLGKVGALIANVRAHQNTQLTAMTDATTGVTAQLNGEPDIQAMMGASYIGILSSAEAAGSTAQQIAQAVADRMVFRDNPQQGQSLTSQNVPASLAEIIRQMKVAGASVLAATVAASTSAFTGTGNGAVITSVVRPFDGKALENAFAENVTFQCTADSYSGGAQAGNESFGVNGDGNQDDLFAFNWPLGSGGSTSLSAINGAADNSQGNLLTNSGFDKWDSATLLPTSWELTVGAAVTHVNEETSIVFGDAGSSALRLTGDGSNLTTLRQTFNDSSGTSGTLQPQTQVSFAVWMRRDGTAPAAGSLRIELVDGNGAVIQDANGANNAFDVDLTLLSTVYAAFTGVFRLPAIMPSTYRVQYRLTTALTNGRSVYLDRGGMGYMSQLYTSGPFLNVHSGASPFLLNDYATATVTNSRGAAGTLTTFQTLLARLFPSDVYGSELLFPSSATPTIPDSLIA